VPPKKSIKIGRGAPAAQGGVEAADVVEALAVEVQCTVERYGIENKFGYRVRGQGSRKNVLYCHKGVLVGPIFLGLYL
jgi:hypothetical protein